MKIGEFAKQTGIDPHTIRYYEKIKLLPGPVREKNGYRNYTEKDLKRAEFIRKAKNLGLNLAQISHILDLREKGGKPCAAVRKILEGKLAELKSQIQWLSHFYKEFEAYIQALPEEGITGEICGCIETHKIFVTQSHLH